MNVRHVVISILAVFLLARCSSPSKLVMVADTNRDGKVNFTDDLAGRNAWTRERGAMFLFNNDSDQNNGRQDCSDKIINGPNDLLDLAPLLIQRIRGLAGGSRLWVSVSEPARPYVHLFYKNGPDYVFADDLGKQEIPATLLKAGDVELRIEATSYAFAGWDGLADVTATLETSGKALTDTVRLKVAPFTLLSSVRKASRIYVRECPGENDALIGALRDLAPRIGVELKTIGAAGYPEWEVWLQDIMEIGFSRIPQHGQHVVLKANRARPLDDMPEKEMLGPDFGWFKVGEYRPEGAKGGGGDSWLDWYGNLEVTPPLPGYPYGRVFYGYNKATGNSLNPQVVQMLEAQGVQTPLIKIHTGWLVIKHVDEIFNFVPSRSGKGFKLLVPDTTVMVRLLDKWVSEGKGALPVFAKLMKNKTLEALAEDAKLRDFNIRLQRDEVEGSIGTMMKAIDLDESDLIRIPALFEPWRGQASALMPNMVNAVFMNGHLLTADPWGPRESGRDLVQDYVKELLGREGIEVHFVDDLLYHNWGGEVHCATNVMVRF